MEWEIGGLVERVEKEGVWMRTVCFGLWIEGQCSALDVMCSSSHSCSRCGQGNVEP